MTEQNYSQEEIYNQIYGDKNLPVRKTDSKIVTKSSVKLDDGVKTVEDRLIYWQEIINNWRIAVTQNEQVIILFCIIFGIAYSYAINECTGNLNFPIYSYVLMGVIIILMSLLQITEGALPLVIILKYVVSMAAGHVSMMMLIAIDGHTWHAFTTDVCRYPVTTDSIMVFLVGGGVGYIFKTFEEIREGKWR